jgi:hypothetical protein
MVSGVAIVDSESTIRHRKNQGSISEQTHKECKLKIVHENLTEPHRRSAGGQSLPMVDNEVRHALTACLYFHLARISRLDRETLPLSG